MDFRYLKFDIDCNSLLCTLAENLVVNKDTFFVAKLSDLINGNIKITKIIGVNASIGLIIAGTTKYEILNIKKIIKLISILNEKISFCSSVIITLLMWPDEKPIKSRYFNLNISLKIKFLILIKDEAKILPRRAPSIIKNKERNKINKNIVINI